jgi:hypothetical protein
MIWGMDGKRGRMQIFRIVEVDIAFKDLPQVYQLRCDGIQYAHH